MRKDKIVKRKQLEKKTVLGMMLTLLLLSMLNIQQVNAETKTILTIAVTSPPKEKPSTPQEAECTIEATLKDENGNPLPNMDIDFYQCGTSRIGKAKTNSVGVASIKYTPFEAASIGNIEFTLRTVTYKINAEFRGTTNYTQSSSEDIYIEYIFRDIDVFLDYGSYVVAGGLIAVAIIGVVGYIVFRRRKTEM